MRKIGRRGLLAAAGLLAGCSPAQVLNATVPGTGVLETADIPFGPGPRDRLDLYRPADRGGRLPLVVFLYGGSWRTGSKSLYPFVGRPLASRGAVVLIPDYRLYPAVRFPTFLEDNARAVAWALHNAAALGADPGRLVLLGHSAGAFNALMLALDPAWLGPLHGRLAGTAGLAGPYHFLPTDDPDVIPVFGPANTPAHEPYAFAATRSAPLFLAAGGDDTTVQPRNTTDLARAAEAAGTHVTTRLYPGLGHIGLITALAPLFQSRAPVLDDLWRFIAYTERTERD